MGGKGKASKLKHHGMSGIEEVAERRAAADAFNGGGIDRPNERARYQRRRRRRGREGNGASAGAAAAASIAQSYRFYYWLFQYRNVMLLPSLSLLILSR